MITKISLCSELRFPPKTTPWACLATRQTRFIPFKMPFRYARFLTRLVSPLRISLTSFRSIKLSCVQTLNQAFQPLNSSIHLEVAADNEFSRRGDHDGRNVNCLEVAVKSGDNVGSSCEKVVIITIDGASAYFPISSRKVWGLLEGFFSR